MKYKNLDTLKKIINRFDLIKQFEGASAETKLELSNIIKELILDLVVYIDMLENYRMIHNWKYCKKLIEGQVIKDKKLVLVCDEVIEINLEEKIVRTVNEVFRLGKELGK